ncbi:MAG TPA: Rpn family recombination-promoting nuclease/putative transposase, partial [Spirochaetota bacterium]|nr:Rpn family recombination-promoting nuclease/putative transposase [Spirochaetota bacterium]
TDFGFKKLFGEEASKDLLIDFLNEVLKGEHTIVDLTFKPTENFGTTESDRKAIFDIYCKGKNDESFIVEMQKAKINFFKDRTLFYTTFPIREQAEKGEWDYKLKPVYCVAILDFEFEKQKESDRFLSNVKLKDQYCEVFYDKLTFIFIEMPRFKKQEGELDTHFDKWLYFLKNLPNFDEIPNILREPVFIKGFQKAEISKYNQDELRKYEESLKIYRDLKGVVNTSFYEGEKIGIEKGEKIGIEKGKIEGERNKAIETAKKMKSDGLSTELILKYTGLSIEEIDKL